MRGREGTITLGGTFFEVEKVITDPVLFQRLRYRFFHFVAEYIAHQPENKNPVSRRTIIRNETNQAVASTALSNQPNVPLEEVFKREGYAQNISERIGLIFSELRDWITKTLLPPKEKVRPTKGVPPPAIAETSAQGVVEVPAITPVVVQEPTPDSRETPAGEVIHEETGDQEIPIEEPPAIDLNVPKPAPWKFVPPPRQTSEGLVPEARAETTAPDEGSGGKITYAHLRGYSSSRIARALAAVLGEPNPVRISGSHRIFKSREGVHFPLPVHGSHPVPLGTLRNSLTQLNVTPEELIEHL